jgi:chromate reductase
LDTAVEMLERRPDSRSGTLRILGISGSARKNSFNTALLEAAKKLVPPGVVLETFDVSGLPLFNQDLEAELPRVVREFKEEIRKADAVLFSTPEHNYSVPALLKNAIEWGDRPETDNSWDGKPAAIMSASTGPRGGVRAQMHLRQIMVDLNMYPINQPQLLVAGAHEKFDPASNLTDEKVRGRLRDLLYALVEWTKKLRPDGIGV